MAGSVLGKRQRGAGDAEESLPLRSGCKRRLVGVLIHQDANTRHPSKSPTARARSSAQADNDLQNRSHQIVKGATAGNSRSKRNVRNDNTLSPSKINSHFRVTKSVNDENAEPAHLKTPQSKRFRDALADSPVTPKHKVQVAGKPLTPRTPRSAKSPAAAQTVYTPARQLFARNANPERLIGRDQERTTLTTFIETAMRRRKGGCIYVSGPPGTGKSALLDEVCRDLNVQSTIKCASINCVSMRSARDVYGKLVETLCDDSEVFLMSETKKLESIFLPSGKSDDLYLVVLDEIDHLLAADSEILYTLFEWSLHKKSHLLLIGIANALDLTDRFLPRLKTKNLKPTLLPFLPYTSTQIADVITTRLRSLLPENEDCPKDFVPFVQPAAIQLCAKKVASQSGDLRKAFDLIKRALDVIEQETLTKLGKEHDVADTPSKKPLVENANLASPTKASRSSLANAYTPVSAPRASVAHLARITAAVFGQGTNQRLRGLNLQQKAALCALIALDRKRRAQDASATPSKSRSMAPTVRELFDTYCALCRSDNILHPLTATEFRDVIGSLETLGLVGEFQGRGRGGTIANGSGALRTPSKNSSGPSTPLKGIDEKGLACFVSEKEILDQISGPGEGVLKGLLAGEF